MSNFLSAGGGYKHLRVFRLTEIIYDLTMIFGRKFVRPGSRTRDQIEQAARSGRQNIAEGSAASVTSKETEIKLTNVAKASLEELLLDYEDYLRQNNLTQWMKDGERTIKLRAYVKSPAFDANPLEYADKLNAEEFCNLCITLINQATYMLRRLLEAQQRQFIENGGIREQMTRARLNYRNNQNRQTGQTGQTGQTSQTSSNPKQS